MNSKKQQQEEDVRRIIREAILVEDSEGPSAVTNMSAPFGMRYASDDLLAKAFIKPFTDVLGVAWGGAKKLAGTAKTAGKAVLGTLISTLIPVLKTNWSDIFEKHKSEQEEIHQKYKHFYDATIDAFKHDDIVASAFISNPGPFLASGLLGKMKDKASTHGSALLDGLIGNKVNAKKVTHQTAYGLDAAKKMDKKHSGFSGTVSAPYQKPMYADMGGSVNDSKIVKDKLTEADEKEIKKAAIVKGAQEKANKFLNGLLADMLSKATTDINGAKSGKLFQNPKIQALDKTSKEFDANNQETRQAAIDSVKKFYLAQIDATFKNVYEMAPGSDLVKSVKALKDKINSM